MKNIHIITLFTLVTFICSCSKNETSKKITNPQDYNEYLNSDITSTYNQASKNLKFWEHKLASKPSQFIYNSKIAASNTKLFNITGDISYLIAAEKNLKEINRRVATASSLRSLARNYISQHKFQRALEILMKAEKNGEKLKSTQKMLFDVHLELGNYDKAENYLSKIKMPNDFDYFIRAAKWNDIQGNLEMAIAFLERALKIAESSKNESLLLWSYTNLADFYGHNNQIEKSYQFYLKALKINPNEAYAKKGIAWIAYSHEKNPDEALRIINKIQEKHSSPDYFLLKAEFAEYSKNLEDKDKNIASYLSAVSNKMYGAMYDQYNIKLYLDEMQEKEKAFDIIQKEIKNRPTPQTYDLLAWAYYKKGAFKEALDVTNSYVASKTFEPEALYHMAMIYKANDMLNKSYELKSELLESGYELGPLMLTKVKNI